MVSGGVEHFRDTGYVFVRAGMENKNVNKGIAAIEGEIDKIVKRGVTARELADAKTHIRGALALQMEDSETQANWYAREAIFRQDIRTPDEYLLEIDRITRDDVQAVAENVFRKKDMRVAVIGEMEKDKINFS
jgi:predicted Zn-dependent peptidase